MTTSPLAVEKDPAALGFDATRLARIDDHFRRYVGSRARVRTRGDHDGRTSFTGELLGATDDAVTVAADTGVVSIAYADIHRSNLLGD